MRNVRTFFLLLLFVVPVFTVAQVNAIKFKVLPYYSPYQNTISDTSFELKSKGDYKIDVLRFYISNIRFFNKDLLVYQEQNSFHLCDAAIPNSNRFLMRQSEKIVYDKLQFDIGIDSITNVSGALGGALDPTNGMYWTWQSGYINFKLEGRSTSCNTRNNEFQFHIGGYAAPFSSLQTLSFNTTNQRDIVLVIDVNQLLNSMDISKLSHIMSPGKEAVDFSKIIARSFRCIPQ